MTEETVKLSVREIQTLFSVVHKTWMQTMGAHLASHGCGLSPLQYGLLRTLSTKPLTLSDLSRKFNLDPSTLVPSVSALVKRGLVKRERDPNDRRRMPLQLTAAGRRAFTMVPFTLEHDPLADGLREMGEDKTRALLGLLTELVSRLPDGESMLRDIRERVELHERLAHEATKTDD
ncbi:MAG: MarR family transcriptional regulator [Chloroflexi bacterium]|nr:MAG: MarR family transcriptional regulator [Chloroflexi bacterium OLB13]MBV6437941.1 hypothetical protein [Anaerolineae bacterium]MCC6566719.1 MarR family transcriptional regulator [Chloroflexota bacterium]MBW7880352.1 MarR family transcriptional regulator [Anaerolineae bacterium]MCO6442878.1 MarR family transcriptional regulator [Anaerolineae bacterium]